MTDPTINQNLLDTRTVRRRSLAQPVHEEDPENIAPKKTGGALCDVYPYDTIESLGSNEDESPTSQKTKKASLTFLEKIYAFLFRNRISTAPDTDTKVSVKAVSSPAKKAIPSIITEPPKPSETSEPLAPSNIPEEILACFPKEAISDWRKLISSEEIGNLASISESSLEEVMAFIFTTTLKLEKQKTLATDKTLTKIIEFSKAQKEILEKITEVLVQDKQFLNKIHGVENVLTYTNILAGIALAAASFQLTSPVGALIASIAGQQVATAFMAAASFLGGSFAIASAGLTGVTKGTEIYVEGKVKNNEANLKDNNLKDAYYSRRLDETRDRMISVHSNNDNVAKDSLLRFIKRLNRIVTIISQR